MAYRYDIFLSYKSEFPFGDWVHESLRPLLEPYVTGALGRPIRIFVDRTGIGAGDAWPERLQQALAYSRCLVAVWVPQYFYSDWCRRECAVMLHRERQLGLRSLRKPSGLILPIRLFDGVHFPEIAKKIQFLDCRDYFQVNEGFRKSEDYAKLQRVLQTWSEEVAIAINSAPRWQGKWLTQGWLDVDFDELIPDSIRNFSLPGL
jgi:hypothetical protein